MIQNYSLRAPGVSLIPLRQQTDDSDIVERVALKRIHDQRIGHHLGLRIGHAASRPSCRGRAPQRGLHTMQF